MNSQDFIHALLNGVLVGYAMNFRIFREWRLQADAQRMYEALAELDLFQCADDFLVGIA